MSAEQWLDDLAAGDPAKQKQMVAELPNLVKDREWTEDFVDGNGIEELLEYARVFPSTLSSAPIPASMRLPDVDGRGALLAAMRSLMVHTVAVEHALDMDSFFEDVYPMLEVKKGKDAASSKSILANTLEMFIVLAGVTDDAHRLLDKAVKGSSKRRGEPPYSDFVPLLKNEDPATVVWDPAHLVSRTDPVEKSMLLLNCVMSKSKQEDEDKAKKLLDLWQDAGVVNCIKDLVDTPQESLRVSVDHFQKIANHPFPNSWHEAGLWKTKYEDLVRKDANNDKQIYLLKQNKPKMDLLTDEVMRCHSALKSLSHQYIDASDNQASPVKAARVPSKVIAHDDREDAIHTRHVAVFERFSTCLDFKARLEAAVKRHIGPRDSDSDSDGGRYKHVPKPMYSDSEDEDDDSILPPSGSELPSDDDSEPLPSDSDMGSDLPSDDDDDDVVILSAEEVEEQEREMAAMEAKVKALKDEKDKILQEKEAALKGDSAAVEKAKAGAKEQQARLQALMKEIEEANKREEELKNEAEERAKNPAKAPPPPPPGAPPKKGAPPPPPKKGGPAASGPQSLPLLV
eukprot:gene5336-953_t